MKTDLSQTTRTVTLTLAEATALYSCMEIAVDEGKWTKDDASATAMTKLQEAFNGVVVDDAQEDPRATFWNKETGRWEIPADKEKS